MIKDLGYIAKERTAELKDFEKIDVRPYGVYLPIPDYRYGLRIKVRVSSEEYKRKVL